MVNVAEMWHGPTSSFKDLALTAFGRLVDFFLKKNRRKAVVITVTSGDTGSAAVHSVLGSENINIALWYPRNDVTHVQELQMTTIDSPNAKVFAVDGTVDDIDAVVKRLYADREFVSQYNLTTLNSINICRVILQTVHFTYLYLKVCPGQHGSRDNILCAIRWYGKFNRWSDCSCHGSAPSSGVCCK